MAAALPVRATMTPLGGSSAKAAAIDFHGWSGWIGNLVDVPDRYRRLGASGNGTQSTGKEHFKTCTAWRQEATAATADAWLAALEACVGTTVTIKDGNNRTLKRCKIHSLDITDVKTGRGGPIAGAATATQLIRVSMLVERLPDA